jgi:hypothetical protein
MPKLVGYAKKGNLRSPADVELVTRARERLEAGIRHRQRKREHKWKQSEQQWGTDHWGMEGKAGDPTADLTTVNISFSTVNTIVPYITGSDPRFLVEPYSTDSAVWAARAQAAWINRYWRRPRSGARRSTKQAAHDSLIYGDGYAKVTYTMTERTAKYGEEAGTFAELFVDRIDPWDLWIDPTADGLHNARWVCERVHYTREELEAEDTFKNSKNLEWGLPEGYEDRDMAAEKANSMTYPDFTAVYEFWDLANKRLVIFTSGGEYPLKVLEEVECPIAHIGAHWLPHTPYHMGELEQIWDAQQELNKTRSQMMTHRRRNIPKVLIKEEAIDAAAQNALTSEVMMQIVKIKGDRSLEEVVRPINLTPLSADVYNVSELITRDVFEITGVNEYLRGATPQIRRTATEASIIEGASNVKTAHRLALVEEFTRDLGTILLGTAAVLFPETDLDEMELLISGREAESLNRARLGEDMKELQEKGASDMLLEAEREGADLYGSTALRLGADVFKGVYEVEVVSNSTELRSPVFKEQKYREMAEILTANAQLLQQMGVPINLKRFYELWFEATGIQDIDSLFEQPSAGSGPNPMAPQPQQPNGLGAPTMGMPPPGMPVMEGQPNAAGTQVPTDLLSALNTGAFPPDQPVA